MIYHCYRNNMIRQDRRSFAYDKGAKDAVGSHVLEVRMIEEGASWFSDETVLETVAW